MPQQDIDIGAIDEAPRYGCSAGEIRNLKNLMRRVQAGEKKLGLVHVEHILAVLSRELAANRLKELKWFSSASDDLPVPLIHFGHFKCRVAYIAGLRAFFQGLLKNELGLDDSTKEKIHSYLDYEFTAFAGGRTIRKDIDFMNEVLGVVIENLERLAEEEAKKKDL